MKDVSNVSSVHSSRTHHRKNKQSQHLQPKVMNESDSCDYPFFLPPEVWEMVFDFLKTDSEALLNSTRVCDNWDDLLCSRKPLFLFDLVLPLIETYLSSKDLLSCRRVCKSWKHWVDKFTQNQSPPWDPHFRNEANPSLTNEGGTTRQLQSSSPCHLSNTFSRPEQLEQFLIDMHHHRGSPFPSRTLAFQTLTTDLPAFYGSVVRHHRRLRQLLEEFGSHIWSCTFISSDTLLASSGENLKAFLIPLRNLRRFTLVKRDRLRTGITVARSTLEYQRLTLLPRLPHLSSLNVSGLLTDGILDLFLKSYGSQLQTLECDADAVACGQYFGDNARFSSLLHLKIHDRHAYCLNFCSKLATCEMPRLEALSLEFNHSLLHNVKIPVVSLFRSVESFSQTLTQLYLPVMLDSSIAGNFAELEKGTVEFPNLKVFGIGFTFYGSPQLLIILKSFPVLEALQFHGYLEDFHDGPGVAHQKEFSEENDKLWEVIPSLNVISLWSRMSYKRLKSWSRPL